MSACEKELATRAGGRRLIWRPAAGSDAEREEADHDVCGSETPTSQKFPPDLLSVQKRVSAAPIPRGASSSKRQGRFKHFPTSLAFLQRFSHVKCRIFSINT